MIRKEFILKLLSFSITIAMAILYFCPIGKVHVEYEYHCSDFTDFTHNMLHYKLFTLFCICILLCIIFSQYRSMLMLSIGLNIFYILVRRISFYYIMTLPLDWDCPVKTLTFTPNNNYIFLSLWCMQIFVFSFLLYYWQQKEQKKLNDLIKQKLWEEKVKEERYIQSKF